VPDFCLEREISRVGFKAIAGLDEVGRGALFGPVVAASVIFPLHMIRGAVTDWLSEVKDSKQLSPTKRVRLAKLIAHSAEAIGVGLAAHSEIDLKNVHWASLEAMKRAFLSMPCKPDYLLVDGFNLNDVNYPQMRVIKGDQKSISIAAASIVAKVFRDEMIIRLDPFFHGYALYKNKGYGTAEHFKALRELGPSAMHRSSFHLKGEK
jgi:ribonuclease HII